MRQVTSLRSLCRHSSAFPAPNLGRPQRVSIRHSSLSAIHRGLLDSQKARPQGYKGRSINPGTSRASRNTSRKRQDPEWTPVGFKITKGKKDISDEGPQPKSRRARFNDPAESFGKKSLVYQINRGSLRDDLALLRDGKRSPDGEQREPRRLARDDSSSRSYPQVSRSSSGKGDFEARFGDKFERKSDENKRRAPRSSSSTGVFEAKFGGGARGRPDLRVQNSRATGLSDKRPRRQEGFSYGDGRRTERSRTLPRTSEGPRREQLRPTLQRVRNIEHSRSSGTSRVDRTDAPTREEFQRDDYNIRIHHTTAASQFLYGRSVVEAALKDSGRQLYNLYVYAGEGRQRISQDGHLEKLAIRKDVKVTKITDPNDLRMMDKMSGGRPHNGCILEASPLPQVPVKHLGALSSDPKKPGFAIELSRQSSEEAAINGNPDFIPYKSSGGRMPFVLLLDGILDPGNLGAILRSAAFLGVRAIAITKGSSATLTPVALKSSAGASEVLTLFSISSTVEFLQRSQEAGWTVYASVATGPRSRGNSHLTIDRLESYDPLSTQPTILVIGSEGEGLSAAVKRVADFEVSIPGNADFANTVDSLNVSVATGILCSAFLRKSRGVNFDEESTGSDESQLW